MSFLPSGIECITLEGYIFSHITEMIIETFSSKRNMSFEYYLKQAKPMLENKLNQTLAKKPHLINALDRGVKHRLIRRYSHIPFNN